MFTNLTTWFHPKTVEEALTYLKKGEIVPYAGGTGILRVKSNRIRSLVDLKALPLSYLTSEKKFYAIGACSTLSEIAGWEKMSGAAEILRQAASAAASTPLRNRITLGGSLASPPPWSDFPPVLLTLDASIIIHGTAEGVYTAQEYFNRLPLDGTSLITEVRIPRQSGIAAFKRVTQTTFDYSMLDLAIFLHLENKIVKECRIAVGCLVPRALRLPEIEQRLRGVELSSDAIENAVEELNLKPSQDKRASKEYRRDLLKILLRRTLFEMSVKKP